MKAKDFVRQLESYYGEYKVPAVKATVYGTISQYPEDELDILFGLVIGNYTNTFGKQPDVAIIAQIRSKNKDSIEQKVGIFIDHNNRVLSRGKRIGHYDGARFLPDLSMLSREQRQEYLLNYSSYTTPASYVGLMASTALVKVG